MNFTDKKFARIKRFVEKQGRDAAYLTVASIDTALPCSPRSRSYDMSFDVCASLEKTKRVK